MIDYTIQQRTPGDSLVTICCECKRVKVDDSWYPQDISGVDITAPGVRITHGYCKPCADEAMREFERIYPPHPRKRRDTQLSPA